MNYTKAIDDFLESLKPYTEKVCLAAEIRLTIKPELYYDTHAFSKVLVAIIKAKEQSKISRFISRSLDIIVIDVVKLKLEQLQDYFEPRLNYAELREIITFLLGQGFTKEKLQAATGISKYTWSRIFKDNNESTVNQPAVSE